MSYQLLLYLHVTTALLSLLLFIYRGIWVLRHGQAKRPPWMKWLPHSNDTLLLVLGISLMFLSQQYPLSHNWLSAKLAALLVYILLGMVVMKWARHWPGQLLAFVGALLVFAYMIGVAITKQPLIIG